MSCAMKNARIRLLIISIIAKTIHFCVCEVDPFKMKLNQSFTTVVSANKISPPPEITLWTQNGTLSVFGEVVLSTVFLDITGIAIRVSLVSNSSDRNATLGGHTELIADCGSALFLDLTIDKVGYYRLYFTSFPPFNASILSDSFEVRFGTASHLALVVQPEGVRALWPFQMQPKVEIRDFGDNLVASDSSTVVQVALSLPAGSQLQFVSSDNYVVADRGIADFRNVSCQQCQGPVNRGLALSNPAQGVRLKFSSLGMVDVVLSRVFDVAGWPPVSLYISQIFTESEAARPFSVQPVVSLLDKSGSLVSWTSDSEIIVSASIQDRLGIPNTLAGNKVATITRGLAVYTDLEIEYMASGYILQFQAMTTLSVAVSSIKSNLLKISSGAPYQLSLQSSFGSVKKNGVQPKGGVAAFPLTRQPIVEIQDKAGNWASNAVVNVSVQILNSNGSIAQIAGLGGSLTVLSCRSSDTSNCLCVASLSNCGSSEFTDLTLLKASVGYMMKFISDGLRATTSDPFDVVVGQPFALKVIQQPGGFLEGQAFQIQPIVAIQDKGQNIVNLSVLVSADLLPENFQNQTIMRRTSQKAEFGIARFTDLSVSQTGSGFMIVFRSALSIIEAKCDSFTVASYPVDLRLSTNIDQFQAGAEFSLVVDLVDVTMLRSDWMVQGNTITISVSLCVFQPVLESVDGGDSDWSCNSNSLKGTTSASVVNGSARFTSLKILSSGNYRLEFIGGAISSKSTQFRVVVGTPANMKFVQPVSSQNLAGVPFLKQPAIALIDAGGNIVTDDSFTEITAALLDPRTYEENELRYLPDRPLNIQVIRGVVWFYGLYIDRAGQNYLLKFQAGLTRIPALISEPLVVNIGEASMLQIDSQPFGCSRPNNPEKECMCVTYPTVSIRDRGNNIIESSRESVVQAELINVTDMTIIEKLEDQVPVKGRCVWIDLVTKRAGSSYALKFVSVGLAPAFSRTFPISLPPVLLKIVQDVGNVRPGFVIGIQPTILIQDSMGNVAEQDDTIFVTASIQFDRASTVRPPFIAGTNIIKSNFGIARFTNLRIDSAGACYSLVFSALNLATEFSGKFSVQTGASALIVIVRQPSGAVPGQALAVQPQVSLKDAGNNLVTQETNVFVTASIFNQPPLQLQGQKVKVFQNGFAEFSELQTDISMTCMQMLFSSRGKVSAKSDPITVVPLKPTSLAILTDYQPSGAIPGRVLLVQPRIAALDVFGNINSGIKGPVKATLLLGGKFSDCSNLKYCLLGETEVHFGQDGIAVFTNLQIDKANDPSTNYSLIFQSPLMTPVESKQLLYVEIGSKALRLGIIDEPRGFSPNQTFFVQPKVGAVDLGGNVVASTGILAVNVVIEGSLAAFLAGTKQVFLNFGVATFTDLAITTVGRNISLKFFVQSSGFDPVFAEPFDVPQVPSVLVILQHPKYILAGQDFSVQPKIQAQDDQGRKITTLITNVSAQLVLESGIEPSLMRGSTEALYSVNGVAAFTNLRIDKVPPNNTTYRIRYTYSTFSVLSESIIITSQKGISLKVVIQVSDNVTALEPFISQPVVELVDEYGNRDLNASISVTAKLVQNSTVLDSKALFGSTVAGTLRGIASFTELGSTLAGIFATISFSAPNVESAYSNRFFIQPGPPQKLVLTSKPQRFFVNRAMSPQPFLHVLDLAGNIANVFGNVSVELINSSGCLESNSAISGTCGNKIDGLDAVQPYCLSSYIESNIKGYCNNVLLSSNSNGTIVIALPDSETSQGILQWKTISDLNLTARNVTFKISLQLNDTLLRATCVASMFPLLNISSIILRQASDSADQLLSPSLSENLIIARNMFDFQKILNISGLNFTSVQVSLATIDFKVGSCHSITSQWAALVAGAAQFNGLMITFPYASLKLRFAFGTLETETDSFSVTSEPTKVGFSRYPDSTAQGGALLMSQPWIVVYDTENRVVTFEDFVVDATLVATDGLSVCSGAYSHRCTSPVSVCSFSEQFCPVLLGTKRQNSTLGRARFSDLAVTTCNEPSLVSSEKYSCVHSQYILSFRVTFMGTFSDSPALFLTTNMIVATGEPSKLVIEQQPSLKNVAGIPFTSQPVVIVLDAGLNRVARANTRFSVVAKLVSSSTVTESDGNSYLQGRREIPGLNGIAVFTDLTPLLSGSNLSLQFEIPTVVGSLFSHIFNVTGGNAAMLRVLTQPVTAYGGELFPVTPEIQICDIWSNVVRVSSLVSARLILEATSRTPPRLLNYGQNSTADPLPTLVKLANNGIAKFTLLAIDKVGFCYILEFSSPGLQPAQSSPFDVSEGTPYQMRVMQEPKGPTPGYIIAVQPIVWICDRGGNLNVFRYSGDVLARLTSPADLNDTLPRVPSTDTLRGTLQRPSIAGQVMWSDLRIDKVGSNYRMLFSVVSGGMDDVLSSRFHVFAGLPYVLAIHKQPSGAFPGASLSGQPEVRVEDAAGNEVTIDGLVVVASLLQNGLAVSFAVTGPPCSVYHCMMQCVAGIPCTDPSLRCPTCTKLNTLNGSTASVIRGYARFETLAAESAGSNFSIMFSCSYLIPAISQVFDIALGKGVQIRILRQAGGFLSGSFFRDQPIAALQDIGNNTAASAAAAGYVRLSIVQGFNLSRAPSSLFPEVNLNSPLVNGIAMFSNVGIQGSGPEIFLVYTSSACFNGAQCLPGISFPIAVSSMPSRLAVNQNPIGNFSRDPLARQPIVYVTDDEGILVTGDDSRIVKAELIGSGISRNATLYGKDIVVCERGICEFTDLSVNTAANYTLKFTSTPLQSIASKSFSILGPTRLVVTREPGGSLVGNPLSIQPILKVTGALGTGDPWIDSDFLVTASIQIGSGAVHAELGGTTVVLTSKGFATFTDLTIGGVGSQYVLEFRADFLDNALSEPFDSDYEVRPGVCADAVCAM